MSEKLLKIGDKIKIPFPNDKYFLGEIIDIDNNVDPRIKYTVEIEELKVIIFYSENMIRKIIDEE